MPRTLTTLLFGLLVSAAGPAQVLAAPELPLQGERIEAWSTMTDDRTRSEIAYPGSVFQQKPAKPGAEGQVLVSHNGEARMLVGSFMNEGLSSLQDYRQQLLEDNYRGADIDYAPIGKGWFVVSGTMGGMMFYERVSFTCGGRYINSWAMLYPVSHRRFYDRVVEAIAPTFQPGRGAEGRCE